MRTIIFVADRYLKFLRFNYSMGNTKDVQEIYTTKVNLYHHVFFDILKYDRAVHSFFQNSNYVRSQFKILDAGCGSGLITKIVFKIAKEKKLAGVMFHAFDLTKAMLHIFRKWIKNNNLQNIELKQANVLKLEKLPKHWKNYDLIISSAMLEYVSKEELKIALSNLRNLLKPKGTMIIFITKQNFVTNWLVRKWWKARTYNKNEMEQIFSEVGFKTISFKQFLQPYTYLNFGMFIIEVKK